MHVLLDDDQGRLALRRLWPWQRLLARGAAARLDRALAEGASPEESASLAARAMRLTSTEFRRDLAASLRRILVAAGEPALPVAARPPRSPLGVARPLRVPLRTTRIGHVRAAARRAGQPPARARPDPGARRGDGHPAAGRRRRPLYRDAARDDLAVLAGRAADALTW